MKPMASEITPRSGLKADPLPVHTGNYGPQPSPGVPLNIKVPNVQPAPASTGVPAIHTSHQPPINRTPRIYRAGKPGM